MTIPNVRTQYTREALLHTLRNLHTEAAQNAVLDLGRLQTKSQDAEKFYAKAIHALNEVDPKKLHKREAMVVIGKLMNMNATLGEGEATARLRTAITSIGLHDRDYTTDISMARRRLAGIAADNEPPYPEADRQKAKRALLLLDRLDGKVTHVNFKSLWERA